MMKRFIKEQIKSNFPDYSFECLEHILEFRAKEKDNELNKELLKELVLKYSEAERRLAHLNQELTEKQEKINQDLRVAAGIQQALLPQRLPQSGLMDVAWRFIPCGHIGGDIFNVFQLDENNMAFYMIDVSGHGVPSALVTVSVSQTLHPDSGYVLRKVPSKPDSPELVSPAEVLNALDEQYPLERFDMFFTIVYGIINLKERSLKYSKAGHPPPILLSPQGECEFLELGGPIIGMGGTRFEEEERRLHRGQKIILYTDGITEYENSEGAFFGSKRLCEILKQLGNHSIDATLESIVHSLFEYGNQRPPEDDVSLLGFEIGGRPEFKANSKGLV